MANSISYANSVDVTDAATFIPTVYSLEVLAPYKKNVVMANLVTSLNHKGKKGNSIVIPVPVRGTASAKTANNVVTLITNTESSSTISLNQHWEYSRVIEDIVEFQALPSIRRFYMNDAGYALARKVDTLLLQLAATWGGATAYLQATTGAVIGSDGVTRWDPTANANTGNGAAISDAGMRALIQGLDDTDTPTRDRYLVLPPVEKRRLLAEPRFTEQAFVGERGPDNAIRNGFVMPLYGVDVYVSSNVETLLATDAATSYRPCLLFQREALVLAEQVAPRVQTQYKQEALGTLVTADTIFGVQTVRGLTGAQNFIGCKAVIVPTL
jgi:hypothetical protein